MTWELVCEMSDIWHKYHLWYFKIVSNFTRLAAREISCNNFEISLVVFMPNITATHAITNTNILHLILPLRPCVQAFVIIISLWRIFGEFFKQFFVSISLLLVKCSNTSLCYIEKIVRRDDCSYSVESHKRGSSKLNARIGDACPQG